MVGSVESVCGRALGRDPERCSVLCRPFRPLAPTILTNLMIAPMVGDGNRKSPACVEVSGRQCFMAAMAGMSLHAAV